MPRAGWVKPSSDERLTDHIAIGVLTGLFPGGLVDEVVVECGRRERRSRLLPARVAVYFTLSLALFSQASYEEAIRQLVAGLDWAAGWRRPWRAPSKAALFKARARLGEDVLAALFARVARPLAEPGQAGAWLAGRRLVAVDGTTLDVPDTDANAAAFGRPGSKAGTAPFPQVRVLGLAECGTNAVLAAELGALREGEQTLAKALVGRLDPSMLLLADRGFFSFELWRDAAATGADLLWRMKKNSVLPALARLEDGSFLSRVYPSTQARRREEDGIDVRVVEYDVADEADPEAGPASRFRLATTILDPAEAAAPELAAAYKDRWRIESAFRELKTYQGGRDLVLRSKSPDLVRQEVWAFLCVHYAVRWVAAQALAHSGQDPGRASFTTSLRAARRTVATHQGFSPLRGG
jgi:hypothetical protein